jgi:hypothetical protein
MKKIALFILFLYAGIAFGQTTDTVVQWTFPDSNLAVGAFSDGGLAANIGNPITTVGGTSTIIYNRTGLTTYCARAAGWDNGSGTKYWLVYFSTLNYNTLKLSSVQQSATASDGPRDFKVQYATSLPGTWTDVPLATVLDSNDWTHGVLTNVDLPAACDNQDSVYLRWIMTSNTSVSGATVLSNGPSKIDDIIITGVLISSFVPSFDNPCKISISQNIPENTLTVFSTETMSVIAVYDIVGNLVYCTENSSTHILMNTLPFQKGIYIIKVMFDDTSFATRKISI